MKKTNAIEILGFDRIGFVDELTKTVGEYAHIIQISFQADGVKAQGKIVFQTEEGFTLDSLLQRIKAIKGLAVAKLIGLPNGFS